jgi:hypothetical protein
MIIKYQKIKIAREAGLEPATPGFGVLTVQYKTI